MLKIDTSSWKEFRIGDLFESANGDVDIQKSDIDNLGEYVVSSGVENTGLIGRTSREARVFDESTITVDMFGNVFYRPFRYKMVTHARVFSLSLIDHDMNEKIGLFLQSLIAKKTVNYSYSDMCSFKKLADQAILLPVTESGEIDWDYMQERIAELEQERIAELEQYLIATGLNDYELTEEDKEVLSLSQKRTSDENRCDADDAGIWFKEMRQFKLSDLYEKKTMKGYPKIKENLTENPDGYYIYGQNIQRQHDHKVLLDSIYLHEVDPEHPLLAYASSVGEIGMITESFYRSGDNGAFQGLFPKDHRPNVRQCLFILSALKRQFASFGYSTSMSNVMDLEMALPVTTDGSPDWDFMEQYIRAIEKIVIADTIKWKDEMIEATKKVAA